ncbi:hypothetical protein RI820_000707 [Pluralibacter gergoviae]|nr:hypothetical protein [Pluralibacter gergoviae]ELC3015859.1 hypothetical protein [Pluralibacter gergoviae]ELC3020838.1 hypothetical protein [Pluralibacter gergoviae]
MKDKDLQNQIRSSLLALQYPAVAEACVKAEVNAEQFSAMHEFMTGELPAVACESESGSEEMDGMAKQLHDMLAHPVR